MIFFQEICTNLNTWNGKSGELNKFRGEIYSNSKFKKGHHIYEMLKKNDSETFHFWFSDGWGYNVVVKKISHIEAKTIKQTLSRPSYPQVICGLIKHKAICDKGSFDIKFVGECEKAEAERIKGGENGQFD